MSAELPAEVAWLIDLTQGYNPTTYMERTADGPVWTVEYISPLADGAYQADFYNGSEWELAYRKWDRTHGLAREDFYEEATTTELVAAEIINVMRMDAMIARQQDEFAAQAEAHELAWERLELS